MSSMSVRFCKYHYGKIVLYISIHVYIIYTSVNVSYVYTYIYIYIYTYANPPYLPILLSKAPSSYDLHVFLL